MLAAARRHSPDEVRLIEHVDGRPARHGDEDALVEPIQVRCRGFDTCRCMEKMLVDVALADAARPYVDQSAAVSLQRVADLGASRAVRQDDLPRGAAARHQVAIELWAGKRP